MKKLIFTTAISLVLATGAYAQQHHGPGGGGPGGGGGGMGAHGPSMGGGGMGAHGPSMGGGAGPRFSAQRGPSGPSMGNHGPTGNVYNRAPARNAENNGANRSRFTERNNGQLYNRYEGGSRNGFENRGGNRAENGIRVGRGNLGNFRHGIASGNFFEHGRHFGFRRFWNGEWVFLTALDSCTAWAWVNVGPGAWAWSPIDICIG